MSKFTEEIEKEINKYIAGNCSDIAEGILQIPLISKVPEMLELLKNIPIRRNYIYIESYEEGLIAWNKDRLALIKEIEDENK